MKARYLLIRTFGFLMSALLVINFMIPSNATSENKDERVLLFLDGLNEISISQPVRIIVYESTESYSDNDYYVYNEEMVLELFVEGHNYVAFTRPSKFFSTAVDLNTLPYGFGITEQTHFFTTNDTEYVFRVERIQEVKLQKDGDEYYPVFLSEKGEELVSNYSISTRVISYKDNNDQSQIEITKEISLSYGGLSRLFTVLESISYANECEKNGLLYEYGFMAEDEYVQWIAETVLDGRLEVFIIPAIN